MHKLKAEPLNERDFESWISLTACGGGTCEWAEGQYFPCILHGREALERQESAKPAEAAR